MAAVTACDRDGDKRQPIGWSSDHNPLWPGLIYKFSDENSAALTLRCHDGIKVVLGPIETPTTPKEYSITVDDRVYHVPTDQANNAFLLAANQSIVRAIVQAKQRISFKIDGWTRTVPASPLIKNFEATCSNFRQRYPNPINRPRG